jgi:hypothetical protein
MEKELKTKEKCDFSCNYCGSIFSLKKTLDVHIKTNKKCIKTRPKIDISCIWCKQSFLVQYDLEKHIKNCQANKEQIYIDCLQQINLLEKITISRKEEITYYKQQINELQNKLVELAEKSKGTTTINTTYNVTLKCGKPLVLSKKKMVDLLINTCDINFIKQGELGLGRWFMKYGCRNENDEICIQCTDKNRGIFKYINKDDETKQITTKYLQAFMFKCLNDYIKTDNYKEIENNINEYCKLILDFSTAAVSLSFLNPQRRFINYVIAETYKDSPSSFISLRDDEIEE